MKLIKCIIFFISVMSFYKCGVQKNSSSGNVYNDSSMPFVPGKCYAKCIIPDEIMTIKESYAVYTGDRSTENVETEVKEIVLKEATSEWIKKRTDNCHSANPDDCLVWCKVETPAQVKRLVIVQDTARNKQFEIIEVQREVITKEGGFTKWREIVCENNVTTSLVERIQMSLKEKGYYNGPINSIIDKSTKDALKKYQKDNHLPEGNLDFETLSSLGIR